ncbi:UDP-N-acetylglucosamine 2-epimerase [Streptomyces sp. enrichment culture]|uniref:UDP-N-acetylglucosamine 2-epimerase n=1 Tax=Streptomyces sp. enrichment culture TaxID=1795815 RepID=UPI003F5780F1
MISTGQHREMLDETMREFDLSPDIDLAVMVPGQTLPQTTYRALRELEEQLDSLRLEAVPVHGDTATTMADAHAVLPVVLFTQPDGVLTAEERPMTVIDDTNFRVIHGAEKRRGLIPGSDRDSLLLASDEGVTWLYYDAERGEWVRERIGAGELTQFERTGFRGSGDLDAGRLGDDPMAYVAAVEPFHGNTVAVYTKREDGAGWQRKLLDVYGDPNGNGEEPGHQVVCADFDGDDEFLVALRDPWPWQGVMYCKAVDTAKGIWTKWRVSDESVARIATADFNGDGRLDFATTAYSVQNCCPAKEAKIVVHRDETDTAGGTAG